MKNPLKQYGLFGWNYQHLLTHPWKIVYECYYASKWFLQRGWRGYSDQDVWDLDSYLTGWLPTALERLHANKLGHPIGMTRKGWDSRLKRMIEGFEAAKAVSDMEFKTPKEGMALQRKCRRGLHVFAEHFLSLWD